MANQKISQLANYTPAVDTDVLPIVDTTTTTTKKITWANIKATLKTYFDTLYAAALGADDNYVTDAEKTVIGNTSGTNTGDNAANSNYASDYRPGGTDVAIADGGTGASTAAGAKTNLEIGGKISIVINDVTIANTITLTNLIQISIPGGTLGTGNGVRVKIYINDFDFTGSAAHTINLKYGGTTIATNTLNLVAGTNVNRSGYIEALLVSGGTTNSQEGSLYWCLYQEGSGALEHTRSAVKVGTAAENSTTALNLTIDFQWGAASASNSITMSHAVIEKIS